jgi:hypothetical protein
MQITPDWEYMSNSEYYLLVKNRLIDLDLYKYYYTSGDFEIEIKVKIFNEYYKDKLPHCSVCDKIIYAKFKDLNCKKYFFSCNKCGDHKYINNSNHAKSIRKPTKVSFVFELHNCQDCPNIVPAPAIAHTNITAYKVYKQKKYCDECRSNHSSWRGKLG